MLSSCESKDCVLKLLVFKQGEPVYESHDFTKEEIQKMKGILEHYEVEYKLKGNVFYIPCFYYDNIEYSDIILTCSSCFCNNCLGKHP
jgi:hypothetical protein